MSGFHGCSTIWAWLPFGFRCIGLPALAVDVCFVDTQFAQQKQGFSRIKEAARIGFVPILYLNVIYLKSVVYFFKIITLANFRAPSMASQLQVLQSATLALGVGFEYWLMICKFNLPKSLALV